MPATLATNSDIDARKRKALSSLGKLPPFSPILNKLLATLAGEEISFTKLGDLIEKDTVVAGNVLRVVNSAIYARRTEVNSVRHALSVLGIDKVRNIVLGMSISNLLNQVKTPPSFSMERFNRHSAAVALLSDNLAQHARVEYPEGAFVAGLLHDIGRMLIVMALPEDHEATVDLFQQTRRPWIECEMETLGFTHAELSASVLLAWKLPEPIQAAAREHHAPPAGGAATLARVIEAADRFVICLGDSILPDESVLRDENDEAGLERMEALGLKPEVLERVVRDFQAEHAAIAGFFR